MNSRPLIQAMNFVGGVGWFTGTPDQASASYPCNPYKECPRLLLCCEEGAFDARALTGGQVHDMKETFSLFLNLRQIPGLNNQKIKVDTVDKICSCFTRDRLLPTNIHSGAVPGFQLTKCYPGAVTYHSDMWHKWKDPNLTISVAQINFMVEGTIGMYDDGT